jgi:Double zinc ribbon
MTSSTCCFCAHLNPAGAKFCNECASPLHLKPCRACDAVNARDAQACYRCGAAMQAAPDVPEASPERIVAEAGEMLAALQRELVAATAPGAVARSESIRDDVDQDIANIDPTVEGRASGSESSARTEEQSRENAFQRLVVRDDPRASRDVASETTHPEPTFDPTSTPVRPDERQWRPERRSRGWVVAVAIALVVLPVAVHVMRNPAQLDEWLGRTAAPSTIEPAPADATSAAAPVAVPQEPVATSPAAGGAPASLPNDAATQVQPARQDAAGVVTLLPPSPPADLDTPDTPASVVVSPDREAKAAAASRSRSSAARTRPRERVTKPRPQAPPVQSERGTAQSAAPDQAPRTEPCTEAVAALGLCSR